MNVSLRRTAGFVLLAVCAIAWAAVALLPFVGVSLAEGAALATVLIVVGEGAFVLGVALLGKDIVVRLRALLDTLKARPR